MGQSIKTFSIVVPVYQNEQNLLSTIDRLNLLKGSLPGYRLELVFVDDGSTDGSREVLLTAQSRFPELIKLVFLTRNFGQTPATQAGLHYATGDCVGIISCDLQEPPEAFAEMLSRWEAGSKFVIGYRAAREESPLKQKISRFYWSAVRRWALRDFPEDGYDFCLLDRQLVEDLNRINEKNSSIFVLIYWLGYRADRIPIRRELRKAGRSQWSFWRKISFTIDTLFGFTYVPARVISLSSLFFGGLAITYLVYGLIRWYVLQAAPPGWMTLVGLISISTAVILFALGVISEYLMRILDESRRRPPFLVDRVVVPQAVRATAVDLKL